MVNHHQHAQAIFTKFIKTIDFHRISSSHFFPNGKAGAEVETDLLFYQRWIKGLYHLWQH